MDEIQHREEAETQRAADRREVRLEAVDQGVELGRPGPSSCAKSASPRAELGELLTGTAPGRSGDDEITVFESLGLAAEDLAAASFLYQKATRLGIGTAADF